MGRWTGGRRALRVHREGVHRPGQAEDNRRAVGYRHVLATGLPAIRAALLHGALSSRAGQPDQWPPRPGSRGGTRHSGDSESWTRNESQRRRDQVPGRFPRATSRYDRILINAYSQGGPIAAAVIAQLPQCDKVSLVTVGSPLRRLFSRGFPAYFGYECLNDLRTELRGPDPSARWRNAVRKSDYVGDYVFEDPYGAEDLVHGEIDMPILDPPCVVPDGGDDVTLPPIHGHSDFWPDPQVAVMTKALIDGVAVLAKTAGHDA